MPFLPFEGISRLYRSPPRRDVDIFRHYRHFSTFFDKMSTKCRQADMCRKMSTGVEKCRQASTFADICRHLSTFVDICRHLSTFVDICRHLSTFVDICRHLSTFVDICRHLSTFVDICRHSSDICQHMSTFDLNGHLDVKWGHNDFSSIELWSLVQSVSRIVFGGCDRRQTEYAPWLWLNLMVWWMDKLTLYVPTQFRMFGHWSPRYKRSQSATVKTCGTQRWCSTCFDVLWYVLTCFNVLDVLWFWCALTCFDMLWHALTC